MANPTFSRYLRPSTQIPNGRAKFANRDFGRELPIIFRDVVFSATTHIQKKPLARAIR